MFSNKTFNSVYICQECTKPITLEESLTLADFSSLQDLISLVDEEFKLNSDFNEFQNKQDVNKSKSLNEINKIDFKNEITQKNCLNLFFESISRILGIKQPLCESCTLKLIRQYENKIQALKTETTELQDYFSEQSKISIEMELSKIDVYEFICTTRDFFNDYYMVIMNLNYLQKSMIFYKNDISKLDHQVTKSHNLLNYNNFHYEKLSRDEISQNLDIETNIHEIERLICTNVLELAFEIREAQPYVGVINGCVLGKLTTSPINWPEFNSALGSLAHLIVVISHFADINFKEYTIYPSGNRSMIEINESKKLLNLWDIGALKMFWDTRFDQAVIGLLSCVAQLILAIEKNPTIFKFPHLISNDLIFEDQDTNKMYSVKNFRKNMDEWTKAMYLVLVNLKIVMAWYKYSAN